MRLYGNRTNVHLRPVCIARRCVNNQTITQPLSATAVSSPIDVMIWVKPKSRPDPAGAPKNCPVITAVYNFLFTVPVHIYSLMIIYDMLSL